jgi:hypothetical protein
MQELAASYLEHFSVEFGDTPSIVLAQSAPEELRELDRRIAELFGPGKLVCVFEALNVAADSDMPFLAEIDQKVCPLDIYHIILEYLAERV